MPPALPKVTALLTCMHVTQAVRPTLHEVFRSLSVVPGRFVIYCEFQYEASFSYYLRIRNRITGHVFESEEHLILKHPSGRIDEYVPIEWASSSVPAGSYDIMVIDGDTDNVLAVRSVFFGEMQE